MWSDAVMKSESKPVIEAIPKPVVESWEPEPVEVSEVEAAPKVTIKPKAPVKPKPVKITNHEPMDKPAPPEPAQHGLAELPADIRELQNWPLIKIILRFGTSCGLESYLKSVKMMEEITERRIKNYKANGELVTRDIVARQII